MSADHHPLPPVRLRPAQELAVHGIAAALWLSGAAWLLLEHFVRIEGAFGPAHHPAQRWLMVAHGAVAMLAVWGFGALWTFHIQRAWKHRRHRLSGGAMFGSVALLSLSGLLLYYAGSEALRAWTGAVHWVLGLAFAGVLGVHAVWVPARERAARRR